MMVDIKPNNFRRYKLTVECRDKAHAVASSPGHILTLGVTRGNQTAGFNAAETLLASRCGCLITSGNSMAEKMRLRINGVRIEIEADRRDEKPDIVQVRYRLILDSPELMERLKELYNLAFKWEYRDQYSVCLCSD